MLETHRAQYMLREGRQSDAPFVFKSWLESYRRAAHEVPGHVYYSAHRKLIDSLLARSEVRLLVDTEDANTILAFLVSESLGPVRLVHYVYTKQAFRRFGLASALFASCTSPSFAHSFDVRDSRPFFRKHASTFNPYLRLGGPIQ